MKKTAILLAVFTVAALVLAACSPSGTSSSSQASSSSRVLSDITIASSSGAKAVTPSNEITLSGSAQKVFTAAQLKQYNGKNGNPAYVAVNGVVYDVTNVKEWKSGSHQGLTAGQDLTAQIAGAPHGTSVLSGLTVVGSYQG